MCRCVGVLDVYVVKIDGVVGVWCGGSASVGGCIGVLDV